jgi:hypothetical protein
LQQSCHTGVYYLRFFYEVSLDAGARRRDFSRKASSTVGLALEVGTISERLTFRLRGPFSVTGADGRDLTPRLAKSQGILLLLLTGTDGTRGRSWVQDRLWSDRGPDQAAASLRQALSEIRRCLGDRRDLLRADRRTISLDLSSIDVLDEGSADFAEGLDIRDPEFDAWLAAERALRDEGAEASTPRRAGPEARFVNPHPGVDRVAIIVRSDGSEISHWTAQVLADGVFLSLSDSAHVEVFRCEEETARGDASFHVCLELTCVRTAPDRIAIRIAALSGTSRRQLWAGHCQASLRGGPPLDDLDVLRLTNGAVEALTIDRGRLAPGLASDPADELLRQALVMTFSMRSEDVAMADRLLQRACEVRPSPLYLAWRLQIRTIQKLERHAQDETALREEGEALASQALGGASDNSMVLALLANASLFLFRDPATSLQYGRLSMERNPTNPMAAWALSTAKLYNGDAKGAYAEAIRGRHMTMLSPRRFFWDLQHAATAMVLGKSEEAIRLMEGITLQKPQFRPPLRYLIALNATQGNEAQAMTYKNWLTDLEPDFSIDRMMKDRDYPASLVHRTSLIEAGSVLAIR